MFELEKESNEVNSFIGERVPDSKRQPWIGIAAIYFGMTAALSSFSAGGSLTTGLNLIDAILATVIGSILLIIMFFIPMGYIGAKEGLNTYVIGEYVFGKKATNIITGLVIAVLPGIGFYGVQVTIAAEAVNQMIGIGQLTTLFIIILGILFVLPSVLGITSMKWLDYISIPAILLIVIYGFVKVINITGMEGVFSYTPNAERSIFWGANLILGASIAGASFSPDYTRWIRSDLKSVTYTGATGIIVPKIGLTIVGSAMALTATTLGVNEPWDIAQVLAALGVPSLAMILVVLLQWSTNMVGAYSGGVALTKIFGWNRSWWTFIVALLGIVLALIGILDVFIPFLSVLSAFIPPVASIIITEYFIVSKRRLETKGNYYWPAIIIWLIGGISSLLIPVFIPAINGFLISMVGYYLFHKFIEYKKI